MNAHFVFSRVKRTTLINQFVDRFLWPVEESIFAPDAVRERGVRASARTTRGNMSIQFGRVLMPDEQTRLVDSHLEATRKGSLWFASDRWLLGK